MTNRRRRQSRRGQKYSAAPGDLRTSARPRPVRTINLSETDEMAETLRFWGILCSECGEEVHTCYGVDQALRLDAKKPIPGLRSMLQVMRRELGPECIAILCTCGTVGAATRDTSKPEDNAWKQL